MKKLLSFLMATLLLTTLSLPILAQETVSEETNAVIALVNNLNAKEAIDLFDQPSEDAKSIWKYYNQTAVTVLEETDDVWVKVHVGDDIGFLEGYMKKDLLAFDEGDKENVSASLQRYTVNKDGLWLRNLPEDKAEHRTLKANQTVTVVGYNGMWWHVTIEGGEEEIITGFFYYPNAQEKLTAIIAAE